MDKIELGKLIKLLRTQENMQQKELAQLLNVTPASVSKWESGVNCPDTFALEALSLLFRLSVNDLYHPTETIAKLKNRKFQTPPPKKIKKSFSLTPVAVRYTTDARLGKVYEIAYVYQGAIDIKAFPSLYNFTFSDLCQTASFASDVSAIKFSFYDSHIAAMQWEHTSKCLFMLH